MKLRILATLLSLLTSITGFTQSLDTVFMDEWYAYLFEPENYPADGKGYLWGTSWDSTGSPGSAEQAQGYHYFGPGGCHIESVLIWTGIKNKHSANGSAITVKICLVNDSSSYIIGSDTIKILCPSDLAMDSVVVEWNDIDTSDFHFTIAHFISGVYPPPYIDYAVVYNLSDFYSNGDTLSVVAGESTASYYGFDFTWWRQPNTNVWMRVWDACSAGYFGSFPPYEAAPAIFPVIHCPWGVDNNAGFIHHMQLGQNYPNPFSDKSMIDYALDAEAQVSLEIIDANGRIVFSQNEGCRTPGTYTIEITKELPPGIYYYSLLANGQRLTKRMCTE